MQITGRYIIPGEDTNNQFFLLCFQVSESQLYLLFVFICGLSRLSLFIEFWRKFERRSFYLYCQPVPMWSEVHTMTSTTENISFQESRTGDSLTVDLTVVHSEIANASDEVSQDDHFEFDIDDLKDQLGIDHIILKCFKRKTC